MIYKRATILRKRLERLRKANIQRRKRKAQRKKLLEIIGSSPYLDEESIETLNKICDQGLEPKLHKMNGKFVLEKDYFLGTEDLSLSKKDLERENTRALLELCTRYFETSDMQILKNAYPRMFSSHGIEFQLPQYEIDVRSVSVDPYRNHRPNARRAILVNLLKEAKLNMA